MHFEFLWPILQEIDAIWLSISLLSTVFFFFIIKVKFQKKGTLKAYGIFFYAFVFYAISTFSYLVLNAMDSFFRLPNDLYFSFIWFFPLALISAAIGALVGWMIYYGGIKVAAQYAFKLMNISLIIIAPTLLFVLLIKPLRETMNLALGSINTAPKEKSININNFEVGDFNIKEPILPAIPSQLFDSILVDFHSSKRLLFMNQKNGFTFSHNIPIAPIEQVYLIGNSTFKQVNVLALSPAIQGQSALLILDSLGMVVYQEKYENGINRLGLSSDNKFVVLLKSLAEDKVEITQSIRVKP
ncbi:MAG: hypothetical protein K9H61_00235 [Bacteroidia bacterium]|nr:hypothetical protein [Bacteroidia bacterium]MCF8445392.1 hypothetical protein [Bacteroidia bacterium]